MSPGNFLKKKKKTITKTQCQNLNPNLLSSSLCFHPSPEKGLVMHSSARLPVDVTAGRPSWVQPSLSDRARGKRISRRTCSEEMSFSDLQRSQVLNPIFRNPADCLDTGLFRLKHMCVIKVENVGVLESSWGGGTGEERQWRNPNSPPSCPQV